MRRKPAGLTFGRVGLLRTTSGSVRSLLPPPLTTSLVSEIMQSKTTDEPTAYWQRAGRGKLDNQKLVRDCKCMV
jgi:hypothetical protein